MLVVLFHVTTSIFESPKYGGHPPFRGFFTFGHAGVEFFFVLSGFIILFVHRQDIGQPSRALSYAWKRFRRIYPLYWAVLLPLVVTYFAIPHFGAPIFRRPHVVISSFLLVYFRTDVVIMDVAWTLYHEVLFYIMFAVLILDRRTGTAAFIVWMIASLTGMLTNLAFPASFWCSPLHLLFAMGMFVAWLMRRGSLPFAGLIAVAGILAFLGIGVKEVYFNPPDTVENSLLYGFAAAVALSGLVSLEKTGRVRVPHTLRLLGDASYSIYLVHLPALSLLAKILLQTRIAEHVPQTVSFVLMVVLAALTGIIVHVLLERRMLRALSRWHRGGAVLRADAQVR